MLYFHFSVSGGSFEVGVISSCLEFQLYSFSVPFSPYSDRRFHLFGGRFRTGDPVEYAISAGVIIAAIGFNHITGGQGFAPFFMIGADYITKV
jgi:inner membrane protein